MLEQPDVHSSTFLLAATDLYRINHTVYCKYIAQPWIEARSYVPL